MELGHLNKNFVKNTRKNRQTNIFESFFLDTLKNYILNEKFNPKMNTIKVFFFLQNQGTFLDTKFRFTYDESVMY